MRVCSAIWLFVLWFAVTPLATAADQAQQLAQAQAAVVGLKVTALADARSNATLGRERSGSGVVLDTDGLVLTIGYLVIEADEVDLLLPGASSVPARVVASDPASGFGLVQALAPMRIAPAPLGQAARVAPDEALLFVSGGDEGDLSLARMVARRAFSGSWEYHIEDALFIAPARVDHSGAGLFNARGELVGIGSLVVSDALGPGEPRMPGNMFVPVDLLRPILAELRRDGSSRQSHRPWLGVHCVEQAGELRVVRVNPDSPAEAAGLRPGDRILRIDGVEVSALQPFYAALWRDGTAQRELTLDVRRGDETSSLKLRSADRMQTLRQAKGV